MLGGEWFEDLFGNTCAVSEEAITLVALEELRNQIGLVKKPSRILCQIHKVHLIILIPYSTVRYNNISCRIVSLRMRWITL